MRIEDIVYILNSRGKPGQFSLVDYTEKFFTTGAIGAAGADVTINLPTPNAGFVRLWDYCGVILSAIAANDRIFLTKLTSDQTNGVALVDRTWSFGTGNLFLTPLIGTILNLNMSTSDFKGLDPVMVNNREILRIFVDFAAPVAQTVDVRAWYIDLPV